MKKYPNKVKVIGASEMPRFLRFLPKLSDYSKRVDRNMLAGNSRKGDQGLATKMECEAQGMNAAFEAFPLIFEGLHHQGRLEKKASILNIIAISTNMMQATPRFFHSQLADAISPEFVENLAKAEIFLLIAAGTSLLAAIASKIVGRIYHKESDRLLFSSAQSPTVDGTAEILN